MYLLPMVSHTIKDLGLNYNFSLHRNTPFFVKEVVFFKAHSPEHEEVQTSERSTWHLMFFSNPNMNIFFFFYM